MFSEMMHSPYRFLVAAAVLAAILCLFPVKVDAPQDGAQRLAVEATAQPQALSPVPVGADLSERTSSGCMLHRTLYYAPCGHSVQRREPLPAQLTGLSRQALQAQIGDVLPGAAVTGFSSGEVDVALSSDIPCPLHWMLCSGEDGMLVVCQNKNGEELEAVRKTDIPLDRIPQEEQQALREGRMFDDVQALEGYLESLSS